MKVLHSLSTNSAQSGRCPRGLESVVGEKGYVHIPSGDIDF